MHHTIKYVYFFILLFITFTAGASLDCPPWLALAISTQGKVEAQLQKNHTWKPISNNHNFCYGDKIRTAKRSRATLIFNKGSRITLDQNSTLSFSVSTEKKNSWFINLLNGSTFFRSRETQQLNVQTPFINAVHEGTEFLIKVTTQQTEISVFDGQVTASNKMGEIHIEKGYKGIASKSKAPSLQAITIQPEDAVQWTLYYPSIFDYQNMEPSSPASLQSSIIAYLQNDPYQALKLLDIVPKSQHNTDYLLLRSSLLLSFGSVAEAQDLLDKTLSLEPVNSSALALKAIIAVTKNQQNEALKLAQQAVKNDPQSVVAQIALSYAYQSNLDIESALTASSTAVQLSPNNALAWTRLSELQLSTGNHGLALKSAQTAQTLNPRLPRIQTVLGFVYLAQIEIDKAKEVFNLAISLDSSDPLAYFGLGLAIIRNGDITKGTESLETAVSLAPDSSLMRSYLGKAYYELKNEDYSATELAIAKEMDPKDPTPWFYDAIAKQSTNRPVEALQDMQKAIKLNDNRGVYRSKMLLDKDLAGRSVSLSRIYKDLRFDQLAINESSKSLAINPANFSAHRFLSDTFSFQQRIETSRVSELLQAQLLQPVNINPVQPQSAETGLNILFGTSPSETGFNEFTPLFERNGTQFLGVGAVGNNGTHLDQAVLSGVYKKFSYSLGQFHYESDGFRENNKQRHNLYNLFFQTSVTADLDIQFEFRRRETNEGDLRLNFDPNNFLTIFDREIDTNTPRIGLRYSPNAHSQFLLSAMYRDREERVLSPFSGPINRRDIDERHGYDIQTQYIYQDSSFNILLGLSTYHFDGNRITTLVNDDTNTLLFRANEDRSGRWHDGYIYSSINIPDRLFWTLGLSIVSFEDDHEQLVNFDRVLPKIGLQWQIFDNIRLRAAFLKTVKRSLVFEETLEPTQIAGFSQFFDDFNGTIAERFGIGLDIDLTSSISAGIELSRRNTNVPRIFERGAFVAAPEGTFVSNFKFESQREDLYRAYLYWKANSNWSLSSEYRLERFRRSPVSEAGVGIANPELPTDIWTTTIPLTLRYFNPNGLFASIGTSYVHQKVADAPAIAFTKNRDEFFVTDLSVGYRLPKRFGIISLQIKNLFDETFQYQDVNFQTADPNTPVFTPDRTILGRILINY